MHIGLYPEAEGSVAWEVSTDGPEVDAEPTLHGQGMACLQSQADCPALDLDILRSRLQASRAVEDIYTACKAMDIDYGPAHRGLVELYTGNGEVLAKVSLPASVADTQADYSLHPSLLDSALQAAMALTEVSATRATLPFALEHLEILAPCPASLWVWLREAGDSTAVVQKLDMDLCDEAGQVCVRLRGFSLRTLVGQLGDSTVPTTTTTVLESETPAGLLTLSPLWQRVELPNNAATPLGEHSRILVVGAAAAEVSAFKARYPHTQNLAMDKTFPSTVDTWIERLMAMAAEGAFEHIVWKVPASPLTGPDSDMIATQEVGVLSLFSAIKSLLQLGYGQCSLAWTVITTQTQAVFPTESINPTHASVVGLLGSLAKEYAHWSIRLLDMTADSHFPLTELVKLPADARGDVLVGRDSCWFRQSLALVEDLPTAPAPYKTGGIYVVIGGAGGLGEAWSRWLIEHYQARVIWLGRRALSAEIQAQCDALALLGPGAGLSAGGCRGLPGAHPCSADNSTGLWAY